ncbi:hypothetical protein [Vibrio phage vB_VmeM-Yong XC32]|nr:hypothetical protein [Vibrio phage vB_VmeM-Yong XC31]QAX96488.1 hypothetical protein [Vibrio phage vB_VmeM-Yong XC32]QAX96805.1 hypothetical protein [Vibrio phage vB_VmeM-Yong MS31]QAX97124.1 hypothetical protein [Vibrio phage vB_VmeM-Yong MS32]
MKLQGVLLEEKVPWNYLTSERLKERRLERGIAATRLSKLMGHTEGAVYKFEKNKSFDKQVPRMLRFFSTLGLKMTCWVIPDGLLNHLGAELSWNCDWLTPSVIRELSKTSELTYRDVPAYGISENTFHHLLGYGPTKAFVSAMQYMAYYGYYLDIQLPKTYKSSSDELSIHLKDYMDERNLTEEDLSFKSGLTAAAVSTAATGGKITFDDMQKLLNSIGYKIKIETM